MNNLKTSSKVLIALAAAALVLGVVLMVTVPEPWVESFKDTHSFIFDGTAPDFKLESGERFHSYHGSAHSRGHFGGVLFIGLILFFIFRKRRFHGRGNHSRAIIDGLYAEEKISLEEYQRRRTVIEEEGK